MLVFINGHKPLLCLSASAGDRQGPLPCFGYWSPAHTDRCLWSPSWARTASLLHITSYNWDRKNSNTYSSMHQVRPGISGSSPLKDPAKGAVVALMPSQSSPPLPVPRCSPSAHSQGPAPAPTGRPERLERGVLRGEDREKRPTHKRGCITVALGSFEAAVGNSWQCSWMLIHKSKQ